MNWRATVAAGLIFIALLAFVWVESRHRVAEEGEVFRQSFMGLELYGIDAEKVTRLKIERGEEADLLLERRDGSWHLTEPLSGLADDDEVMRMVQAVAELRPRASREGVDLSEEQFGLADADLVATITYNGSRSAQLKVGDETPGGTERYASVSGSDKLYVVGASTRTSLWKRPDELREKDVVEIATEDVRKLTLDHGDEHIVAVRTTSDDETKWRLTAPLDTGGDEWNIKQVINRIGDFRAEGFLSPEEAAEADTGFDDPQARVTLESVEGEPVTITFGRSDTVDIGEPPVETEIVYARASHRDEVLLLSADAPEAVQKTAFDLRDRSILSFKRDEVTRVRVERAEGLSFTIARRPDGWFVERPEGVPARQSAVDDVLWNLEDVSAVEFVLEDAGEGELREFGLAAPQATITIELRRRDEPLTLLIGSEDEDGSFYAKTGDSNQVVKISEFLMGDLPEDMADLEDAPAEATEATADDDDTGAPDAEPDE